MTRIIAGAARGRRLAVPPGTKTRPTSDRAREGLFATVTALHGPLTGAGVLDLYAGSGAVGLEALSRGAARVLLVESDPVAARVIRANIAAVGLPGARLAMGRVAAVLGRGPEPGAGLDVAGAGLDVAGAGLDVAAAGLDVAAAGLDVAGAGLNVAAAAFDVVVADPPYAAGAAEITEMLMALLTGGWLARGALVAVERASRSGPLAWPGGYAPDRSRRYGEATFWYGHAAGI